MRLLDYLRELDVDVDLPRREALRALLETLMEIDVSVAIDAGHYERNRERVAYRNGYRHRTWPTPAGEITLRIPRLRKGTYYPDFLSDDLADDLFVLAETALLSGVDEVALALTLDQHGLTVDESAIARLLAVLDERIAAFHARPINRAYPTLWLDVVDLPDMRHQVAAIAVGVHDDGKYRALGFKVGSADDPALWRGLLRELRQRGLEGVRLVVSDDYDGAWDAVERVLGARWQYSRAHALRTVLAHVDEAEREHVVTAIATVFNQTDAQVARAQLTRVTEALRSRWPDAAQILHTRSDALLAYMTAPVELWPLVASSTTLLRIRQALDTPLQAVGMPLDPVALEDRLAPVVVAAPLSIPVAGTSDWSPVVMA